MRANQRVADVRGRLLAAILAPALLLIAVPAGAELIDNGPAGESASRQAVAADALLAPVGAPRNASVAALRALAESGSGPAQRRLGELYDRGSATVPRDFAESMRWYQRAREQGEDIPTPHTFRATPWR